MEMERANSIELEYGNGGLLKLPIGFRFHPTDEELVVHYLKKKVFSLPLPATVIPDFDVFHSNPWDLPGDMKEKRYFFCKRRWNLVKSSNTDCGYWKAIGKEKQIKGQGSNFTIGMKKSFAFYQGRKLKTQWIMHQFCLVGSFNAPFLPQRVMTMQVGDWVVCRLYQRKKRARNDRGLINRDKSRSLQGFDQASPLSCSSGITEVSCNELDAEESS